MNKQIVEAKDMDYNRNVLEKKKDIIMTDLEYSNDSDSPKYLGSGLNSIMAKIAAKNRNALGIEIGRLSKLSKYQKARVLSRIRQNIVICNKSGTLIAISKVSEEEKRAIIESLGGSTKQSSQAISF